MTDIFDNVPDKRQDKNTTSLKFKRDLIEFFGEDYKDKTCLEIGTHRGYTTKILSSLFNKVITCEVNKDLQDFAKVVNKDNTNVEFLLKDVYNTSWDFNDIDVVFIDCDHEISSVLKDIKNAISLCKPNDSILIVFDDYGLVNPWEGVKEAIAKYDNDHRFQIIREIGEPKGSDCNPRANLRDVEGVICKYTDYGDGSNVVFLPTIDLGNNRNSSYKYAVDSWKNWCDKNNCELLVWDELILPIEEMKITWQRYYLFDILNSNEINYNQILMVDADTIVHPDCPNFFELSDMKYCGVMNNGDYEWVNRSIKGFGELLFDNKTIHPSTYINGGFQIVNKKHEKFFDKMKLYYEENSDNIKESIKVLETATDQTILNFMLKINNIDVKVLPDCFNLQDLARKNLLYIHESCFWGDVLDNLYSSGWVYHFNGIPGNDMDRDASYWMKRVYEELYT